MNLGLLKGIKELAINFDNILCYGKTFNLIWTTRYSAKTTQSIKLAFSTFLRHDKRKGSVLFLYRYANQISNETIRKIEERYNEAIINDSIIEHGTDEFVDDDDLVHLYPIYGNKETASITFTNFKNGKILGNPVGGIAWIGAPEEKLKDLKLNDLKYVFFDEYVVNPETEKYGKGEFDKIIKVATTLNRASKHHIRFFFTGNTYTKTNPMVEYFKIDEKKIIPGAKFCGSGSEDWAVWAYKLPQKIVEALQKDKILKNLGDDYFEFIFGGRSHLMKLVEKLIITPPKRSFLRYIFYLNKKFFDVKFFWNEEGKNCYYVQNVKRPIDTWSRPIYCIDKIDLAKDIKRHRLIGDIKKLKRFIDALNNNHVYYDGEGSYFTIYNIFQSYINTI